MWGVGKGIALATKVPYLDMVNRCLPGDITVTRIPYGYLLGRALAVPQNSVPGPWWEYIAIVEDLEDATHHARTLAQQDDARAWIHGAGDHYEPL